MNSYKLKFSRYQAIAVVAAILAVFTFTNNANAQRSSGEVGIGAQIGQPTGLTVKIYGEKSSIDFLAAWDWDQFFFLNVHSVYDAHLNDQDTFHFFYGPGAFIGIRDRGSEPIKDEVGAGVSGTFGLDLLLGKLELFIQATPRLELIKSTNFDMGGGGGFRVYF